MSRKVVKIFFFVIYDAQYTNYDEYFIRYASFSRHWSCKNQPNTRDILLSKSSLYNCLVLGQTKFKGMHCAGDILQPISCETVLRQSPTGPRHDSATGQAPGIDKGIFVL